MQNKIKSQLSSWYGTSIDSMLLELHKPSTYLLPIAFDTTIKLPSINDTVTFTCPNPADTGNVIRTTTIIVKAYSRNTIIAADTSIAKISSSTPPQFNTIDLKLINGLWIPTNGLINWYTWYLFAGTTFTSNRFNTPNTAYIFDNGGGVVLPLSTANDVVSGTGISISAWIYFDNSISNGFDGYIFSAGADDANQKTLFELRRPSNNANTISASIGALGNAISSNITANTWKHVAMTYNGTTMYLYIDGTLVGSRSAQIDRNYYWTDTHFTLGIDQERLRNLHGTIDTNVRLYNRALTGTEVKYLYHENGWN